MGALKPKVEASQPKSQATPLANDVLANLQRELMGGTYAGMSPLQKDAGTALRQFVQARQSPEMFNQLAQPLTDISRRETNRGAADLREGFGIAGSRFGTPMATGEAQLRSDAGMNLDAMLAQLFSQQQGELLQGIGGMQQFGAQNMAPIFDFAKMGVLPEELFAVDSDLKLILDLVNQGAQAYATSQGLG